MNQLPKLIKREELYEAVWSRTIKTLAQEWNTTYLRLVHACEEMEVPRPSQGHWQLIARGQVIEKEPLRERTGNIPVELVGSGIGCLLTANQARLARIAAHLRDRS